MEPITRRNFMKQGAIGAAGIMYGNNIIGNTATKPQGEVRILNPKNRAPVSLIIDDSTALVNLAYFGIPQFKEVFPDQYLQDWKKLPREIPDDFVREFGDWCAENGVKGKYSMVPYPACTGWLHRFIPGWTSSQLRESLKLVRDFMQPNWDINPEMISHTRVINIKTGLPYPDANPEFMENWEWSQAKSSDELGSYIAYALNILKEAGLSCTGITTPGGFGSKNMSNLALGTLQAMRDVYGTEIPHFFRDVITEPGKSVEPQLFHVSGLDSNDPKCSVHIIGCTDDWFGNWDGLRPGNPDLFISSDLLKGRMIEVIDRGDPAIIVCHWPGVYFNGEKTGFDILKEVHKRLNQKYNNLFWMKLSEISRYWAAKKLTSVSMSTGDIKIKAPFSTPWFTISMPGKIKIANLKFNGTSTKFVKVADPLKLENNNFYQSKNESFFCFELPKGESVLEFHK